MTEGKGHITIRGGFCIETRPGPFGIAIFGASGDLANRKLLPSLFSLFQKEVLRNGFYILGVGRTGMTDETYRQRILESLGDRAGQENGETLNAFLSRCYYETGDYQNAALYYSLSERMHELDQKYGVDATTLFYLATPPHLYGTVVGNLGRANLTKERKTQSRRIRVILEKPFGRDQETAKELDRELHRYLEEGQIYRIDHYLGKETVQNILMFRFANAIFEPLWNREYVDHVQITVSESIGIGHRAGYYEKAGLLRDMFQNHLLQLLTLVAMEPPVSFNADRVRDEKYKLLLSLRPFPLDSLDDWIVRGQYAEGTVEGERVPAYREEEGVETDSTTETFVAARVMVDNWRWQGVPFYLRSGKRMPHKLTEIAIVFKNVPHSIFAPIRPREFTPNTLVLNIQPEEGIALTLQAKQPGPKLCISSLDMDFRYREVFGIEPPEAYERLLVDAVLGDQTLFWRSDSVEAAWTLVTPVLKEWENARDEGLHFYSAGSWGPGAAHQLLRRDGRTWRDR